MIKKFCFVIKDAKTDEVCAEHLFKVDYSDTLMEEIAKGHSKGLDAEVEMSLRIRDLLLKEITEDKFGIFVYENTIRRSHFIDEVFSEQSE